MTVAQQATLVGFPSRTILSRGVVVAALVALALAGGNLDPPVFTGVTTGVLVALLAFKMRSVSRDTAGAQVPETAANAARVPTRTG